MIYAHPGTNSGVKRLKSWHPPPPGESQRSPLPGPVCEAPATCARRHSSHFPRLAPPGTPGTQRLCLRSPRAALTAERTMKDCNNGCSAECTGEGGSKEVVETFKLFEGLKAFRGVDNKIRLFRPNLNMDRMYRSAMRATLPAFDKEELLECIQQLVKLDQEWVPHSTSASLYIRPTFIGTEPSLGVKKPTKALLFVILSPVGPYFSSGSFNPVSLWANPKYVRAWKGGTGDCKMGGNYGSSLFAQCEAMDNACQQVLWLYGEDNQITEVGTMNLFLYWINEDGEEELATPPLDGIILPGVTRQSILDLAHEWGEFKVSERYLTMDDLNTAVEENRVREMFGSGTACVVCPVSNILYKGETIHIPTMENGPKLASRILDKLTDIQYGREESDWTITVS
ncbi:branched-chain-amino-acid aminotransferase, cytosolic isoform X1 [Mesoplodon densirostris]|uniref:branched-chain-amino-acid aminotransferase, cytosolic isoform X1 n=1 Tax=Mesoplodon densirostris TaxID=48708 RepID=UPI0028DC0257|nr:branched-chain-amino-acid aminotransferase, cytosolic isoform X1 [Mesoplodon densirostris]